MEKYAIAISKDYILNLSCAISHELAREFHSTDCYIFNIVVDNPNTLAQDTLIDMPLRFKRTLKDIKDF